MVVSPGWRVHARVWRRAFARASRAHGPLEDCITMGSEVAEGVNTHLMG